MQKYNRIISLGGGSLDEQGVVHQIINTIIQQRMVQMLQFTIWQRDYEKCEFTDELEGFRKLKSCSNLFS